MSDYIKRDDAIKAVANNYWHGTECECYAFAHKALDDLPSADVAPVRRGHWVDRKHFWTCSECRKDTLNLFRYCPNCGARMDK